MSLGIYIPSMGRATHDEIGRGPLADIVEGFPYPITYVVPEEEGQEYADLLDGYGVVVATTPPDLRGIAKTRHWIGEHARSAGHDKFLMLDDDIRFLIRRSEETWQLRGTEGSEVEELMIWIERMIGEFGYGHVGVSAREGNNRSGVGGQPLYTSNTRTLRALAYSTEAFLSVEHGRVEVMEDFDVNLQLLRRGIPNCVINYWAQGQKMTNAPGGCSTYRSHEVHEASAVRLTELHPGLVSLRDKVNKTDTDGFGSRKEVTIQWKAAYGHG